MSVLGWFLGKPQPAHWGKERAPGALGAAVKRLEIRAKKAMEEGFTGRYISAFKGLGLEFEEVREYTWGDDIRSIDWNVTARSGKYHVRRYREERDMTVLVLVDLSSSTGCGSGALTVHDAIVEAAALLVLAAAKRDRVGAVLFAEAPFLLVPPRQGWKHGLRIVRDILAAAPRGRATGLADALARADAMLSKRSVLVALVDRWCPLPVKELRAAASRHQMMLVRVWDPGLEMQPPAPIPVKPAELGRGGFWETAVPAPPAVELPPEVKLVELATDQDVAAVLYAALGSRGGNRSAVR